MAEPCPRCGAVEVAGERCPRCGVVIALYRAGLEKLRRGPVAAATALAAPVPAPTLHRLTFHGTATGLFGISAVNALLTLLTLGVF